MPVKLPPLSQRIASGLADASADEARRVVFDGLRPRLAAARHRYPDLQDRIRTIKPLVPADRGTLLAERWDQWTK